MPVFGRLVELPLSMVGRPFLAELLDLRGQTVAIASVDAKQIQKGAKDLAKVGHPGLYLVKCTGENGVVVRKFMAE